MNDWTVCLVSLLSVDKLKYSLKLEIPCVICVWGNWPMKLLFRFGPYSLREEFSAAPPLYWTVEIKRGHLSVRLNARLGACSLHVQSFEPYLTDKMLATNVKLILVFILSLIGWYSFRPIQIISSPLESFYIPHIFKKEHQVWV